MKNDYIDFHCHPALKPFGKSFNYKPIGINRPHRSSNRSIWKYNPPSVGDKLINFIIGLTKFSQSNFTSLAKGGISIACVSLYPIEKWFFRNKIKNEIFVDLISNFATGVGKKRIDHIQGITNYFQDLEMEYKFYKELDGQVIKLPMGNFKYKIVNNFAEIKEIRLQEEDNENDIFTICVIISIEGLHVLNSDLNKEPNEKELLSNLNKIKNWDHLPFFVTVAHHFWNHICGHSKSLTKIVGKFTDQSEGLNEGIQPLGMKVIEELLDNKNGKRILIDVKHMSPLSRNQYYKILEKPQYQNIPIIVSHGAVNGLKSSKDKTQGRPITAVKLNQSDINFFDEEIIKIALSGGIIGLQLDERRVANKNTLKNIKHSVIRSKIMHYRSELLWNQIQHIVEVLDSENLFAWDCMAIGSDYDGIIDPLNSFWTAEELPFLADFLERHAHNYVQNKTFNNINNKIKADKIISRIMSSNGMKFFETHF